MLDIILAPVLGGVIGYITNDLAIKMLFHPYKAVYIGKWRVPFTPGLIPSQKDRIAKSLGSVISSQLLDAETIRAEALSEENKARLRAMIENMLKKQARDTQTLRGKLEGYVDPARLKAYEAKAVDAAGRIIMDKVRQADLGAAIAAQVVQSMQVKLRHFGLGGPLGAELFSGLEGSITAMIEKKIEEMGPDLIHTKLNEMEKDLMGKKICDLAGACSDRFDGLADKVMGIYESVLLNNLDSMLKAARIDQIIERRIATFDAAQLEKMIFGIMKKELNAIVYLGAALGFLMGFINLLL